MWLPVELGLGEVLQGSGQGVHVDELHPVAQYRSALARHVDSSPMNLAARTIDAGRLSAPGSLYDATPSCIGAQHPNARSRIRSRRRPGQDRSARHERGMGQAPRTLPSIKKEMTPS